MRSRSCPRRWSCSRGRPASATPSCGTSTHRRIAVCSPQVPFSHGGAEVLAEQLVDELNARDHQAALVTIPFKWYPGARVLSQAFLWRLVDLEETDGRPIDLVIGTKFPSYVVRHRRKVVWLVPQFPPAYDLDRTELGQFDESAEGRALRRAIHRLDRVALGEATRLAAISRDVADRRTGLVCEPRGEALAGAVRFLREHPDEVRSFGRAGKALAQQVTWDHAIDRLLA